MFLANLNENEKRMFLDIACTLARADKVYSNDEQRLIDEYCKEMSISINDKSVTTLDEAIDVVAKKSSTMVKRVFIFELIGLALVDGHYHENEKKMIKDISRQFDIDTDYLKKCERIIEKYINFQKDLNELVLGE